MTKINKRDLIVLTWRRKGGDRVGRKELREIQRVLEKHFGLGGLQSPATLARVLADEGAELKHPEIIEFDAEWRDLQIQNEATKFASLDRFMAGEPLTLQTAADFITELENRRLEFDREADRQAMAHLVTIAADARRQAESIQADGTLSDEICREQSEIAEWLRVWLQTPNLFASWVELRKRSAEFRRNFDQVES